MYHIRTNGVECRGVPLVSTNNYSEATQIASLMLHSKPKRCVIQIIEDKQDGSNARLMWENGWDFPNSGPLNYETPWPVFGVE
jgi:hypothetical protein